MSEEPAPAAAAKPRRRSLLDRVLGTKKGGPRAHPYAEEKSPERESKMDAGQVTLLWLGLATAMVVLGIGAALKWSPYVGSEPSDDWEPATWVPLFAGLALLGFGFLRPTWAKKFTLAGWLLFASYWGLTALDLYESESQDIANLIFAVIGVYFFTYLAYHQWLSMVRGVDNRAIHFLNVATFVAAGFYFLIDKIQYLRLWLINVVSDHTMWGLNFFGQGEQKDLVFLVDAEDHTSPTTFFYPDYYCNPNRPDEVGQWCADNGQTYHSYDPAIMDPPDMWWEHIAHWNPFGDFTTVVPVSIIMACTALQSIMLFVGLFVGTDASWKRKVQMSLGVGALVYVLNIIRNVGIIWFYGQGQASFWMMHNLVGKGGSLVAMIVIAFAVFKIFPEFFKSLVGVLDLVDRDGPIERTLKLGRRRPTAEKAAT